MKNKYDDVMQRLKFRHIQTDHRTSPTEEDIAAFEKKIGHRLPPDYREFIMKYGVTGSEGTLVTPDEGWVEVFYGLSPNTSYDLSLKWDSLHERLDNRILPIAKAADGTICMSLEGDDAGAIYWCIMHEIMKFDPKDSEVIAKDFDSFIRSLSLEKS